MVNASGATCGVFALCVLLLAVDTGAVEGNCTCRDTFVSGVRKIGLNADDLEQFEILVVNICMEPLVDTCQDNCKCYCPLAGINTDRVDADDFPIIVCTHGSDGEGRCVGEKDRLGHTVL